MTRSDGSVFDPYLPAELVLRQAEIGVIVADREGCVQFVNSCAARTLRLPEDPAKLAGQPLASLGFIPDADLPKADDMTRQVLRGLTWEGTFTGSRGEGGLSFIPALAVPVRASSVGFDGMMLGRGDPSRR